MPCGIYGAVWYVHTRLTGPIRARTRIHTGPYTETPTCPHAHIRGHARIPTDPYSETRRRGIYTTAGEGRFWPGLRPGAGVAMAPRGHWRAAGDRLRGPGRYDPMDGVPGESYATGCGFWAAGCG